LKILFESVLWNLRKMEAAIKPLARLMNTLPVRIVGQVTDLNFSIRGTTPTVSCIGSIIFRMGKFFICPVRDSVQGISNITRHHCIKGSASIR